MENSLPMSMRYSITGADAIPSRTRLSRFAATSSPYGPNSNNKILIPVQADGFLDTSKSYLYLKITGDMVGGNTYKLDGNIASIIDKLEISVAGASGKVETIDRYNLYHLYDQIWNSGFEEITYQNAVNGGSDPATNWVAEGHAIGAANSATIRTSVLALKLKGGFLNSYFNKALPQGLPQFTIEITLASGVQALIVGDANSTNNNYSISECRFYAPVYQVLDEGVMNAYTRQIQSSPTMWVGQSVGTIINSVAQVASKQTLQLNASYRSLNSMITLLRNANEMNNEQKNILTATNINNVVGYVYRIMGQQYPQDQIDIQGNIGALGFNVSRVYMEAGKALAPHGHTHAKTTAVRRESFVSNTSEGTVVGCGSLCISLVRFSDDRLVNLGLNTAGSSAPSIVEIDFGAAGPATPQDATTFCLYDCVWVLNPNGLVERSF